MVCSIYRTLVYVEGDASVRVYEDAEGKKQSSLNIVQRSSKPPMIDFLVAKTQLNFAYTGTLEVLKRPQTGNETGSEGTQ